MPPTTPPDDDGSSRAVVRNNGSSSFQTTLDVATAGQLVYNISRPLLRCLVQKRIDVHAYSVALIVGQALQWSNSGRDRLDKALSETNGLMPSINYLLKFGIDVAEIKTLLHDKDDGQCFAALCACLCECYSVEWSAKIILQLIKKILDENPNNPSLQDIYPPSLQSIKTVVERFSGLFATSDFGVRVEEFMSHDGHDMVTGYCRPKSNSSRIPRSRGIASPEKIADALYEICQLSRNKSLKVALVGGADAVAVAAVGFWLADLPVSFRKLEDEALQEVATSHGPNLESRVVVVLSQEATYEGTLVQGRLIYLPPLKNVIRGKEVSTDNKISGRVYWNSALSTTFKVSLQRLKGLHSNFGPAIGCAARVFQALTEGDDDVPLEWRTACQTYYKSSFGIDYVLFALDRFPELKKWNMEEDMRKFAALKTFDEAEREFEKSMFLIAEQCHCKYCCFNGRPTPKRTAAATTNEKEPDGNYCLIALSCAIIRLIRVLSGIGTKIDIVNERGTRTEREMFLNRSGLECFYNQQHDRLMVQRKGAKDVVKDELFLYRVVERVKSDKEAPEYSPLAVAHTLFSGRQLDKNIQPQTSAIAIHGICCFFNILEQSELRGADEVSKV
ncbi:hypothetical protein DBV05_g8988 [Lasiodiplodia theobromae]|uniref:Uncharacterized protein n=1 Tax=Lasiodiplodia theobromae TaxID=45133 RepID=A0A5N5D3S4_9PEZI|nr:hypothetical protein DBV05_g8988 [Lasiodiplodia theobromae]